MMTQSQHPIPASKQQPTEVLQPFTSSAVDLFVDDRDIPEASVRHAQTVANAFGGNLVLVQVLSKPANGDGPVDPVEWDIKKQQTLNRLGCLTKGAEGANLPCRVELLEGQCTHQIRAFMESRPGDIAASMRCRDDRDKPFSETTWGVLLSQSAAILMIPDDALIEPDARYRRILVPLDGSARAETVLPVAVKLARAQNAELVLCYVLPDPGLTEVGTKDPETERLHALVRQRNEKTGKAYLDRIKKRLEYNGLKISIRISQGGDARRALIDVIAKEGADFVVMATHGQSGHRDVPIGDVARFIFDKATVPVLLVRYRNGRDANHAFGKVSSTGVRQPAGTD